MRPHQKAAEAAKDTEMLEACLSYETTHPAEQTLKVAVAETKDEKKVNEPKLLIKKKRKLSPPMQATSSETTSSTASATTTPPTRPTLVMLKYPNHPLQQQRLHLHQLHKNHLQIYQPIKMPPLKIVA